MDKNDCDQLLPILPCSETTAAAVTAKFQLRGKLYKTETFNWLVVCHLDKATGRENPQIINQLQGSPQEWQYLMAIYCGTVTAAFLLSVFCHVVKASWLQHFDQFFPLTNLAAIVTTCYNCCCQCWCKSHRLIVFPFLAMLQMLLSHMSLSCRAMPCCSSMHANAMRCHHYKLWLMLYRLFLF